MNQTTAWHARQERGSTLGIRFTVWLYRRLGRGIAELLVYAIVSYFFLTDPSRRRASRGYLGRLHASPGGARALGAPPGARHVFRHFLEFGTTILDRIGFWLGDRSAFQVELHGKPYLDRVVGEGRGALILGSHLGSFDVMRLVAEAHSPITVHLLMFTRHAARINGILRRLRGPESDGRGGVRVIQVQPGSFQHVLEARACIERGDVVAILGDRVPPNESRSVARVVFLGGTALLPEGPFRLAALLRCPVLMMTGLRRAERVYEVHVESFAERVELPRAERREALAQLCQKYADRLAAYCVRAPYQWFNFYEFWSDDGSNASR